MKYKFLNLVDDKIKSNRGNHEWEIGKWYKEEELNMCQFGFHCSNTILDAMSYVQGEILAIVETKGKNESQGDKEVWENMRIIKAYRWTKKDSAVLAIYCAKFVLTNYEKLYPGNKLPRQVIEAAKKVLENDTKENRSAVATESAAWLATGLATESAAWLAVRSVTESAAWSAVATELATELATWSAAWSAVRSAEAVATWLAESAAWLAVRSATESAAWSAAWSEVAVVEEKVNKWLVNHLKDMEVYKCGE